MTVDTFKPLQEGKPEAEGRPRGTHDVSIVTAMMAILLFAAWFQSDERHLTAETGLGYYLGIVGSIMMLLLLVYPLRKRLKGLRRLGAVPGWFRLHMVFGIVGPSLVIIHSNFRLGSLNSRVALFSMLIVAGSGFIGRFLYKRIHRGLSGRRQKAGELRARAGELWAPLVSQEMHQEVVGKLNRFEAAFLSEKRSLVEALYRLFQARWARARLRRELLSLLHGSPRLERDVDLYLEAARRAQVFVIYESLFSLWHLLHLPLFIVLVGAATLHVVAVHLY